MEVNMKELLNQIRIERPRWMAVFCWLAMASTSMALQSGDFTYEINPDGISVTITDYSGAGGAVVIPSTIDSKAVTIIGSSAFSWFPGLIGISIPSSVVTIESWAFYHTSITNVVIPDSVVTLEHHAFYDCQLLKKRDAGQPCNDHW